MAAKRVPGSNNQNQTPPAPQAPQQQDSTDEQAAAMMQSQDRTPREATSREMGSRPKEWKPPQDRYSLKNEDPNYRLRWLRMELDGQEDTHNMESKFEEGYELVSPSDPLVADKIARGELHTNGGKVYRKGLVLARIPTELAEQRNAYYAKEASLHQQGVSQALDRDRDPRMPIGVVTEQRDRNSREG